MKAPAGMLFRIVGAGSAGLLSFSSALPARLTSVMRGPVWLGAAGGTIGATAGWEPAPGGGGSGVLGNAGEELAGKGVGPVVVSPGNGGIAAGPPCCVRSNSLFISAS